MLLLSQVSQEILELLNTTTAKEQSIVEKFRSRGRAQVQEFCDYGTKEECMKASDADRPCRKLHFRSLGSSEVGWVSQQQSCLLSIFLPVIRVLSVNLLLSLLLLSSLDSESKPQKWHHV